MLPFLAALFGAGSAIPAAATTAAAAPAAAGLAAAPVAAGLSAAAPAAAAPAAGLSAGAIEAATAVAPEAAAVTDAVKATAAASRGTPPMWWQKGSTWLDKNLGTDFMSMANEPWKDRLATSSALMKLGRGLSGGGGSAPASTGGSDYQEQMQRLAELIAASRQRRQ